MRRATAGVLAIVLLVTGCAGVRRGDVVDSGEGFVELNSALSDRTGRVVLTDGSELVARHIVLAADSTRMFVSTPIPRNEVIATARIDRIVVKRRLRGTIGGGAKGLLIGLGIGGVFGNQSYDAAAVSFSRNTSIAFMGVLFGSFGLLVGATAGALMGEKDVYDLRVPGSDYEEGVIEDLQ